MALPGEPLSAASETAHDLVGDQIDASVACFFTQEGPEVVRCDDAVGAGVGLHQDSGHLGGAVLVDGLSDVAGALFAAFLLGGGTEGATIGVGRGNVDNPQILRIDLVAGAGVAGKRHGPVGRAVVGAIPGDDPSSGLGAGLARELDGVLVGVGAPEAEEDPPALEARDFSSRRSARRARGSAPQAAVAKQSFSACSRMARMRAGCWWPRLTLSDRLLMSR